MPVAPKSMQDLEQAVSVSDPAAIREQLVRLLAHPLFANSKRYPALLAYVVEQTLLGNASDLKERSIGIEVFATMQMPTRLSASPLAKSANACRSTITMPPTRVSWSSNFPSARMFRFFFRSMFLGSWKPSNRLPNR